MQSFHVLCVRVVVGLWSLLSLLSMMSLLSILSLVSLMSLMSPRVHALELSCRRCPSGSFLRAPPSGQVACGLCPPNSTTLDSVNATAATDCVCVAGHTSDGGSCVACAETSFKPVVGNHSCTACPEHTFSAAGSVRQEACVCAPGYSLEEASCVPCAPGTWKPGASNDACLPCDAAASSVPAATREEQCLCNAGYSGPPGAACHACEAGKYRERDAQEYICADCPADTYNDQLAATLAVECRACATHTSTFDATGARSAQLCVCRGGYSRAAAWSEAAGWACRACAAGSYQPAGNQSECERCAAGKYADQVAADADVCAACAAGSFAPEAGRSACTACGYNTWASVTGAGNCSACPPYSSLNRTGSSNVSDCVCGAGFRLERTPHRCEPCAAGAYCPGRGLELPCEGTWSAAGASECTPCAANSMPVVPQGMTSPAQCQCRPGAEGTHDSDCTLCAPGKFQARTEVDLSALGYAVAVACQPCPANSYQPAPGSAACPACPGNSSAAAGSDGVNDCYCDAGFHGTIADAADACWVCPAGYFCEGRQPLPTRCRASSHSAAGRASEAECVCDAGFYGASAGEPCLPCPRGAFCSGHLAREACPRNSSSPGRSSAVDACMCLPGTWRGCSISADGSLADDDGRRCSINHTQPCVACPADTVCANETLWNCPEHSTAPAGSRQREACICDDGFFVEYHV